MLSLLPKRYQCGDDPKEAEVGKTCHRLKGHPGTHHANDVNGEKLQMEPQPRWHALDLPPIKEKWNY